VAEQLDADLFPPNIDPDTGEPTSTSFVDQQQAAQEAYNSLTDSQKQFVDKVLQQHENVFAGGTNDFDDVHGYTFLLEGSAGTGKTYTLNTLMKVCQSRRIPIMACASTGIAATRLNGATLDVWYTS